MRGDKGKSNRSSGGQQILYDANGTRVKGSLLSNKFVRFLLFWVLPYVVINGIVLVLVCAAPSTDIEVANTDNYLSTTVNFDVHSLLPVKELNVTLDSAPVEYEKSGRSYTATVTTNGTFTVEVTSVNGMKRTSFADISILDDSGPSIDESTINISRGILSFNISDSQSGVNFDSITGRVNDSDELIYPLEYDKTLGLVTMELPDHVTTLELSFEDMVGNVRTGHITVSTVIVDENGESVETEGAEDSDDTEGSGDSADLENSGDPDDTADSEDSQDSGGSDDTGDTGDSGEKTGRL